MKRPFQILITGGAGFVGTHLCRSLTALGHSVTSLDLKGRSRPIEGVRDIVGDVRNLKVLTPLIEEADFVYHLAATVSVPVCQQNPQESYSNNFQSTLSVLEVLRHKRERSGRDTGLLFASTAAVYGSLGDDGRALVETQVAESFSNYYAAQKHASEQAIRLYREFHSLPAMIFRFFNIYGEGQDPTSPYSGVITIFRDRAERGEPLLLNGGGHQTRDFIAVEDIVSGCVKALDVPLAHWTAAPINLGTQKTCTIRDLAQLITQITRSRSPVTAGPARAGDVQHSKASIERALSTLPLWEPRHALAEGLARWIGGQS